MSNLSENISKCLPLQVLAVECDEVSLLMSGERWSFSTQSAWRIMQSGSIIVGCYDDNLLQISNLLTNQKIISINPIFKNKTVDLILNFSNGLILEVFSVTSADAWVLNLPNDIVYVG